MGDTRQRTAVESGPAVVLDPAGVFGGQRTKSSAAICNSTAGWHPIPQCVMWDMGHGGSGKVVGSVQCPLVRPRIPRQQPVRPGCPLCPCVAGVEAIGRTKGPGPNVPLILSRILSARIAACGFDQTRVSKVEWVTRGWVSGSGTSEDMAAVLPHLRNDGRQCDRHSSSRGILCFGQHVQSRETFEKPTRALKLEIGVCSLVG